MKKNVMIIGAGGVAHVAAHLAAMNNDRLGDICIATRTVSKAEAIIQSVHRKGHLADPTGRLYAVQLDAFDIDATESLIRSSGSEIVINLGTACVLGLPTLTRRSTKILTRSVRTRPGMPTMSGSVVIVAPRLE